jgi:hypothetical protein
MMNLAEYRNTAAGSPTSCPGRRWSATRRRAQQGRQLPAHGALSRPRSRQRTPAELVASPARLNNALRRLGSGWAIFVEAQRAPARDYPDSDFPDPASALVDAERKASFEEGAHFESSYFLTFVYLPPAEDAARAETWLYEGRETDRHRPASCCAASSTAPTACCAGRRLHARMCRWLDDARR